MKKGLKILSLLCLTSMLVACGGEKKPDPKPEETWPKVLTVEKNETEIIELMSKGLEDTSSKMTGGFTLDGQLDNFELKFDLGMLASMMPITLPTIDYKMSGGFNMGFAVPRVSGTLADLDIGFELESGKVASNIAFGDVEIPFVMDEASVSTYISQLKIYSDSSNANYVKALKDGLKLFGLGVDDAQRNVIASYFAQKQVIDLADFVPAQYIQGLQGVKLAMPTVDAESVKTYVTQLVQGLKNAKFGDVLTITVNKDGTSEINFAVTNDMKNRIVDLVIQDEQTKQSLQSLIDALVLSFGIKINLNSEGKIEDVSVKANIALSLQQMIDVKLAIDATFEIDYSAYELPDLTGYNKNVSLDFAPTIKAMLKNTVSDYNNVEIQSKNLKADLEAKRVSETTVIDLETGISESQDPVTNWDFNLGATVGFDLAIANLTDATVPTKLMVSGATKDAYVGAEELDDCENPSGILYDGDKVYVAMDTKFQTAMNALFGAIPYEFFEEYGLEVAAYIPLALSMLQNNTYGAGFEDANLKLPGGVVAPLIDTIDPAYFNIVAFVLYPFMTVNVVNKSISIDFKYELTDEVKAIGNFFSSVAGSHAKFGEGETSISISLEIGLGDDIEAPCISYLNFKELSLAYDLYNYRRVIDEGFTTEEDTLIHEIFGLDLSGKIEITTGEGVVIPELDPETKKEYVEDTNLTDILTSLKEIIGPRSATVDVTLPYI